MTTHVRITKNDVGDLVNDVINEDYLQSLLWRTCGCSNKIVTGFDVTNPSGLNLSASAGTAIISGHIVQTDTALTTTASGTVNNYQYIKLDSSYPAASVSLESSATNYIRDRNRCMVSKTDASGGSITALRAQKDFGRGTISGVYVGDGADSPRFISTLPHASIEATPTLVMVCTADSKNYNNIFSLSSIESPGNRRSMHGLVPGTRVWFTNGIKKGTLLSVTSSASWTIDISSEPEWDETSLTIEGISVDSPWIVLPRFSVTSVYEKGYLSAYVDSDDTVKVRYTLNYHNSTISQAGTVYVMCIRPVESRVFNRINLDESGSSQKTPIIRKNGFEVTSSSDDISMNTLSRTYNWLAIF